MNYANIKYYDIANGPGVRTSVFVSGCRHHCPGCFNAVAWDFDYGQPFDKTVRNEVFASCQPDYIAGLSLLGGEPFEPENQRELLPFVRNFKALYPAKTVWCYSGYTWEQLTGKEPSPCAVRGDRRAAGTAGCAGGRQIRAGRARHLPALPRQPQPAPAGCAQVPCRRAARVVGGRKGIRHPYHGTVSGAELLLVKMRLSRPAGRDKRSIKNNSSAEYGQSNAEAIRNRPALKEAAAQTVQRLLSFLTPGCPRRPR